MALRLSLHACAVWPMSIDFDILRAYTAGLSVEEAVNHMLAIAALGLRGSEGRRSATRSVSQPSEEMGEEDGQPPLELAPLSHDDPTLMEARCASSAEKGAACPSRDNAVQGCGEALQGHSFALGSSKTGGLQRELREVVFDTAAIGTSFLHQEVVEQFNLFDILRENYLASPYAFLSSYTIPMKLRDRRRVVEVFYRVDDKVLKFLFGERLHKLELDVKTRRHFFFGGRGRHDEKLRSLTQAGISEGSLKRQWTNLKRVCTFLISAYRGRDEMLIPCTTPLLSALQQCFSLRGSLGMRYATFVFGFEHRLVGRCWEKLSYMECTTICNVLASLWCDDSRLMLRESFCSVCTRIARHLDETRVVAEMHQVAFGETMRPRWQVQLDEVQRAITTNTGVGAAGNLHNSGVSGATMVSPTTNAPPLSLPRNTSTLLLDAEGQANSVSLSVSSRSQRPFTSLFQSSPSLHAATSAPAACLSSNSGISGSSGNIGGVSAHAAPASHNSNQSVNFAFSRRFLIEFPLIIRCLARVAAMIGNFGQLQEALEVFYARVYLSLENIGIRSVPTQNADAGGPRLGALTPPSELLTLQEGADATAAAGTTVTSTTTTTTTAINTTIEAAVAAETELDFSMNPSRMNQHGTLEKPPSSSDVAHHAVVNTSVAGPAVVSATTRHHPLPVSPRALTVSGSGFSSSAIGAVDGKVYLRELCMFLSLLPNIFKNLSNLTEEDHAVCDCDFSNFVLALKVLVQVLMASDDN